MNPHPSSLPPRRASRQGVALILVLGAILFISVLTVAFFGSVNHELVSSKSYASGASARIYADAAVNLVIGQLQAGTTQDNPAQTWVSQPGLIRRFNTEGRMEKAFKLYSSNQMVEGATFSPLTATGTPADVPDWNASTPNASLPWNLYPNLYADLNTPITTGSVPKYPILSPAGLTATTKIDGFEVSSTYALPDSADNNQNSNTTEVGQIPMPVRWMYILTDGQIATAADTTNDTAAVTLTTPDGQPVAATNPPVARIAFWTDDATCRLNLNTASEGCYWSLPVAAASDSEQGFNSVTPREYQRYPGHPAMTSLSPVMNFLTAASNTNAVISGTDLRNFIFAMAPRVAGRGSQFGTRVSGTAFTKPVEPDSDRLYASVDELLFLPNVNPADNKRYRATTANIVAIPDKLKELDWVYTAGNKSIKGHDYTFDSAFSVEPNALDAAKFFLTTDSRAPELNLFGQPRISLWPVDTRAAYQSVYDRLLAFSSTVAGNAYYFQRQNPDSQTEDYDQIDRNKNLMAYLDSLTSSEIPGFGGRYSSKYGSADRQQLLTAIFDWVRTVNLAYRDKTTPSGVRPYAWTPSSGTTGLGTQPAAAPSSGQVLPIKIGSTQGYGRFPTLAKAALGLVRESEKVETAQTTVTYRAVFLMEDYVPSLGYAAYIPKYDINVSGLSSSETSSNGFELVTQVYTSGTKSGSPQVVPLDFNDGHILVTAPANFETYSGRAWGGTQGFNHLFAYTDASSNQLKARTLGNTDSTSGYPFASSSISVTLATSTNSVIYAGIRAKNAGAGPVPVRVTFGNSTGAQIKSYDLAFPNFSPLKGATLSNTTAITATGSASVTANNLQARVNEMAAMSSITSGAVEQNWTLYKNVISTLDTLQGVETNHGDLRLFALHGTDTNNQFVTHINYGLKAQAHSLLCSAGAATTLYGNGKKGNGMLGTDRGTLVIGSSAYLNYGTYGCNFLPQAPSNAKNGITSNPSSSTSPGDFSNGISTESDGPHIIKADEGNSSNLGMNWGMSKQYAYQNQLAPYDDMLSDAFSPNREVASAVQLGTLPSRAASSKPWQTLLFRPDLDGSHPGSATPADYLLLDLFWMPVIDPYPISQSLSTAGKVNLNYQIIPFTYINRSTALLGALKSTRIEAIPVEYADAYKKVGYNDESFSILYDVDAAQTTLFFKERFSNTDPSQNIFKSAAEICSIPLAPTQNTTTKIATGHSATPPANPIHSVNIAGASDAATLRAEIKNFWAYSTLTGDNTLEAPYNALYPRLTTQSNTYIVYVRAQALQVGGSSTGGKFTNIRNRVTGEYRGSYEIERYLDLNDTALPDPAAGSYSKTLYPYYKFRILSAKQFIP
ncbi:MAG: Verru_Chthon cassette protein A [Chthoniobacteraceae bacterium]